MVTGPRVVRSSEDSVGLEITGSFAVSEAMELSGTEGIVVLSKNVDDGATELSTSVEITGSRVEIVEIVETIELAVSGMIAVPAVVIEVAGELCGSKAVSGS